MQRARIVHALHAHVFGDVHIVRECRCVGRHVSAGIAVQDGSVHARGNEAHVCERGHVRMQGYSVCRLAGRMGSMRRSIIIIIIMGGQHIMARVRRNTS